MKAIWIVDDDQSIRWVLEKALQRANLPTRSFVSAKDMLEALDEDMPGALITDIRMPGKDGLELLQEIKQKHPQLAVIVMTAYTDLGSTVSAFQKGAFDYLAKPFDINEAVSLIQRAIETSADRTQSAPPAQAANSGDQLIMTSASPAMQEVFRAIGRLVMSSATVLITGESGTGKELIARALHTHSARAAKPFVALNAAAIPRDLLEAELFGHERGAFTGATSMRRGRFEEADGGTLFLDEIGDMPFELQTRLLRVLAEGGFYRVGGSQVIRVDVRIVAATHQPLEQRVTQGLFREDLFHRLNVIRLRLPPLRERKEDIPALAAQFLQSSANKLGVAPRYLTPQAERVLLDFDYPGNIRQLENFCHWLTVMASGQWIDIDDLPPEVLAKPNMPAPQLDTRLDENEALHKPGLCAESTFAHGSKPGDTSAAKWTQLLAQEVARRLEQNEPAIMANLLREFESTLIHTALKHSQDRRAEAAQRLGIGRNTLTRKYREFER